MRVGRWTYGWIFLVVLSFSFARGDIPGEPPDAARDDIRHFWFLRLQRFRYSPTSPAAVLKAFYLEEDHGLVFHVSGSRLKIERIDAPIKDEFSVFYRDRSFILHVPGAVEVQELIQWDPRTAEGNWREVFGQVKVRMGTFRVADWPLQFSHQPPYGRVIVFESLKKRPTRIQHFRRYPIDLTYRLEATLEKDPSHRYVAIETSRGLQTPMKRVGWLEFTYRFKKYRIAAFLEEGSTEEELFIIYRDRTSGKETYAIGRYLPANRIDGNRYILDFNKSYLPLCAYSHAYNCPIPPRSNHLPFPVRAGEIQPPPEFMTSKPAGGV